ncbi:mesothelin-like protein [Pontoporia blainvillei]|uniref:Mesothelin-like protein n=1 Tax=Pontoporia blainvillei TaxID=48723 RepID=A0ABX0S675_PONBL|nr:mesothelin-like protein [Pontoporia blainvillei]
MGCARGQVSLGIRGPEKGRGLPGPPGVGVKLGLHQGRDTLLVGCALLKDEETRLQPKLDPDPPPVTPVPSCQDDQWAPHSHGPQSRCPGEPRPRLPGVTHCPLLSPQAEGATQGGLDGSRANLWARLTQVREANCQAFVRRTAQGNTGLLANLPDQRATLRHRALACLGGLRPSLSTSNLLLFGVLVCDTDASSIMAADPVALSPADGRPQQAAGQQQDQAWSLLITEFLSVGRKEVTGRPCIPGNITAATLHDGLFLACYDCVQLESCLGSRVLRANLDPLLQHPLPSQCQKVIKAKLA